MRERAMGLEFTIEKSDSIRVHYERKSAGRKVDHKKKTNGVRVHHDKKGESCP